MFCCAVSPDCPPYNTAPSPRTDHHSPTRTASDSCQPWTALRPVHGQHICSQIREMRCITTWSHDSHATNSGACVVPLVHHEVSADLHWDMHLYGLTTCLCLLFLLSALLTRVVCAHALLVSTSLFSPRCVHVCMHACICTYVYICVCIK